MTPIELRLLLASLEEHIKRKAITDFLNAADLKPGEHADHKEFRRLHELWLVARDSQRLAQTVYADYLDARQAAREAQAATNLAALEALEAKK